MLQHQVLNQLGCINRDSISADIMLDEIKRLMVLEEWTEDETRAMVSIVTGVASIDARTSSSEALSAFFNFKPRWTRYLQDNPEIARKIDPVYVVACIVPGAALPIFPVVAPGAPVALTPLHGSGYAWSFPNEPEAAFWCGSVRAIHPALRLWMFTCPNMCVQW